MNGSHGKCHNSVSICLSDLGQGSKFSLIRYLKLFLWNLWNVSSWLTASFLAGGAARLPGRAATQRGTKKAPQWMHLPYSGAGTQSVVLDVELCSSPSPTLRISSRWHLEDIQRVTGKISQTFGSWEENPSPRKAWEEVPVLEVKRISVLVIMEDIP